MTEEAAARIAALNDRARHSFIGCRVVVTRGVVALSQDQAIFALVQAFDDFTERNDPHGEHDFGVIEFQGQELFWKFDYYDIDLSMGSPDPTDVTVTVRVLTIMLAEEY